PHHLVDISTPDRPITAAEYQELARAAITEIRGRGKVPLLVGGTGLYVDAVVFNYSFTAAAASAEREQLSQLDVAELQRQLQERSIALPQNAQNKRHLVRQLERSGQSGTRTHLQPGTLLLGLQLTTATMQERIRTRVKAMMEAGLELEVRDLVGQYGWNKVLSQTIGYQEFMPYFRGEASIEDVEADIARNSLRYAKRQRTWFRRNRQIIFLEDVADADDLVTTFLNN
ncbi:MAG TPA: tRNA dimethylallyltransferase, partial [Ktedonobacteraceae bacterium]|nr:tRNA dimethylallyltransferase [Ktedonobacteraceae bacterium]